MQGTNDETFFSLGTGTQKFVIFVHCQHIKVKICTKPQHEFEEGGQDSR
jgi:hypothetical protein